MLYQFKIETCYPEHKPQISELFLLSNELVVCFWQLGEKRSSVLTFYLAFEISVSWSQYREVEPAPINCSCEACVCLGAEKHCVTLNSGLIACGLTLPPLCGFH